jgi:polysaccharide biosynthesis protein PslG
LLRSGARIAATLITMALMLGLTAGSAFAGQVAGIQTHVLWGDVDDAQMRHQLDLMKASGAQMTRVDVGWASLQQDGPDGYSSWYLGKIDRLVAAAHERGVGLLMTFMSSPCWASTAPESLKQGCAGSWWDLGVMGYAPADPRAYAAALAFLAARYGDKVAAWEVWNEPNHPDFFKASDQAAAYAQLLKAAYPAVKAAAPGATVIGGSLSQSDYAFTQRLYDLGVKGSFDAFAVHPYSDDVSPLDPRSTIDARYSFVRGVPKIREVMQRNGDGRPIWLTESGWSTSTLRTPDHWRNGVSEAAQATFMRQQAEQVARWPYVKVNIWFNLLDAGSDRADKYSNCGLVRVDGTAKPAFAAFGTAVATLAAGGGAPPASPATVAKKPPATAAAKTTTAKKKKRSAAKRRKARRARAARARRAKARRARHARAHRRHHAHR